MLWRLPPHKMRARERERERMEVAAAAADQSVWFCSLTVRVVWVHQPN